MAWRMDTELILLRPFRVRILGKWLLRGLGISLVAHFIISFTLTITYSATDAGRCISFGDQDANKPTDGVPRPFKTIVLNPLRSLPSPDLFSPSRPTKTLPNRYGLALKSRPLYDPGHCLAITTNELLAGSRPNLFTLGTTTTYKTNEAAPLDRPVPLDGPLLLSSVSLV
jgi:hypothetical protein